jgi:hypothetical protein
MFAFRLAFSCIWELTPDAEIINAKFTKSIIRSKVRHWPWCLHAHSLRAGWALQGLRADCVWVWKYATRGTLSSRRCLLNQSHCARSLLTCTQSECWCTARSQYGMPSVLHEAFYSVLEQISYEWGKIRQIRGRAVAVPYFTVTVSIRCDTLCMKKMGSHLNVTACNTVSVLLVSAVSFTLSQNLL